MDASRRRLLAIALLARVAVVPFAAVRAQSGVERIWLLRSFEKGWDGVWREQRLAARATRYAAVLDDGEMVLEADSRNAASGLWRRVSIDAPVAGRLSWRWKIEHVILGGRDERRKAGDDYAARVFVVLGGEFASRKARAICYVWAAREPVGSMYRSPHLEQVATIVVESGNQPAGRWASVERDFIADHRTFFGELPERVSAVALMVDTDNTRSGTRAYFDDVLLEFSISGLRR